MKCLGRMALGVVALLWANDWSPQIEAPPGDAIGADCFIETTQGGWHVAWRSTGAQSSWLLGSSPGCLLLGTTCDTDSRLVAVRKIDGGVLWRSAALGGSPHAVAVLKDSAVALTIGEASLHRIADGHLMWRRPAPDDLMWRSCMRMPNGSTIAVAVHPQERSPSHLSVLRLDGSEAMSTPLPMSEARILWVHGGVVGLLEPGTGTLYHVSLRTGAVGAQWASGCSDRVGWATANWPQLFLGSDEGIWGIGVPGRSTLWVHKGCGCMCPWHQPVLYGGVLVLPHTWGVVGVDAATGAQLWVVPIEGLQVDFQPGVVGRRAYVLCGNRQRTQRGLWEIDMERGTGSLVAAWSCPAGHGFHRAVADRSGVYVGHGGGFGVVALRRQ